MEECVQNAELSGGGARFLMCTFSHNKLCSNIFTAHLLFNLINSKTLKDPVKPRRECCL